MDWTVIFTTGILCGASFWVGSIFGQPPAVWTYEEDPEDD